MEKTPIFICPQGRTNICPLQGRTRPPLEKSRIVQHVPAFPGPWTTKRSTKNLGFGFLNPFIPPPLQKNHSICSKVSMLKAETNVATILYINPLVVLGFVVLFVTPVIKIPEGG